jgi:hypothetical protein
MGRGVLDEATGDHASCGNEHEGGGGGAGMVSRSCADAQHASAADRAARPCSGTLSTAQNGAA